MDNEKEMTGRDNQSELFKRYHAALRVRVGDAKYVSWFKDLGLEDYSEDCVTLSTGSEAKRDMLDHRFFPVLEETWRKEVGPFQKMRLTVLKSKLSEHAARINAQEDQRAAAVEATPLAKARQKDGKEAPTFEGLATALDPRRTFEAFAVHASNRIAWAAAQEALSEGRARELIYFYGPSGVGKTHLLQSIAHAWSQDQSRGEAGYVTYNNLSNACVSAVWSNSTAALHKALLSFGFLGFDDIHFLNGKNRTQEELLIVIDAALDSGKQVVIAGELPPAKLAEAGLNQRLADRLAGGICAPIHPGDETLRLAVLQKRVEQSPAACRISDEALAYIARTFTQSTRETIGALNQLLLMYGSEEIVVDLDEAKSVLKSRLDDRRRAATIDDAIAAGAEAFGLKLEDMTGRSQPQRIVRARHAVVWCAREVLKESFPRIGKALKRDHTTVMSSYRRAQALIERDKAFQDGVKRIREALEG
ncbi:DnaA ATPase domain-containing protein [Marinicaulis aureus]|uniref:Chromosomal replication initiator protein DnaA n=1 Tax=Hyphococcus aureus TaxID=2666033 RepID=A0ABW1KWB8_9PROT